MRKLRVAPEVWADIKDVKRFTLENFGSRKLAEYDELIREAFDDIRTGPLMGRVGQVRGNDVFQHHIKKRGRNARHVFLCEMVADDRVHVLRFLHDASDLKRHF